MKGKINLHQQAAEKARENILQAAQALFIEKGFSGASMSAIAQAAGINQSLVYHYFEDKEDLWRQVKMAIISLANKEEDLKEAPSIKTLDELIDHLVIRRFQIYSNNRSLVRMLMWQALEEKGTSLSGTSEEWMESWLKAISSLQKRKAMTSRFTPHEIMIWLNGIIWAPFVTGSIDSKFSKNAGSFLKKMAKELKSHLQVS